MSKVAKFLRKNIFCRFGTHWGVSHEEGSIAKAGVCTDCGKIFPEIRRPRCPPCKQPKTKNIAPNSDEARVLWNTLRDLLEIPDGVSKFTLYLDSDNLAKIELTYFPKFVGKLPETKPEGTENETNKD